MTNHAVLGTADIILNPKRSGWNVTMHTRIQRYVPVTWLLEHVFEVIPFVFHACHRISPMSIALPEGVLSGWLFVCWRPEKICNPRHQRSAWSPFDFSLLPLFSSDFITIEWFAPTMKRRARRWLHALDMACSNMARWPGCPDSLTWLVVTWHAGLDARTPFAVERELTSFVLERVWPDGCWVCLFSRASFISRAISFSIWACSNWAVKLLLTNIVPPDNWVPFRTSLPLMSPYICFPPRRFKLPTACPKCGKHANNTATHKTIFAKIFPHIFESTWMSKRLD